MEALLVLVEDLVDLLPVVVMEHQRKELLVFLELMPQVAEVVVETLQLLVAMVVLVL